MTERMARIEMRLDALDRNAWCLPSVSWQSVFVPTVVGGCTFLGVRVANRISKDGNEARPNWIGDSVIGAILGSIAGGMLAVLFTEMPPTGRASMVTLIAAGIYAHRR